MPNVDAELRYRLAAPLLAGVTTWLDLGAGDGLAAAAGLSGATLPSTLRVVLVDNDQAALSGAAGALPVARDHVTDLVADLATDVGTAAVRDAIDDAAATLVTCFGVLPRLADVSSLLSLVMDLAAAGATVLLSVPEDGAGALDAADRGSAWSAGAAEELRRLLPAGAVSLQQVALSGSAIAVDGAAIGLEAVLVGPELAARDQIIAFGPGVERLSAVAAVSATDAVAERDLVTALQSSVAFLQARVAQLEADNVPVG